MSKRFLVFWYDGNDFRESIVNTPLNFRPEYAITAYDWCLADESDENASINWVIVLPEGDNFVPTVYKEGQICQLTESGIDATT